MRGTSANAATTASHDNGLAAEEIRSKNRCVTHRNSFPFLLTKRLLGSKLTMPSASAQGR